MQVSAWNNGRHHKTGAGYGLKIRIKDRNHYFKKSWKTVVVQLPNGTQVEFNTDKTSFWNDTCSELIKKEFGNWLITNNMAPWPYRKPPKFQLIPTGNGHFVLK